MSKTRSELTKKLQALQEKTQRGDEKAIAKQHGEGKLTARERIQKLLDNGTFVEEFMLAETPSVDFGMAERKQPTDGVITGYGKIDGRTVYVFAQDFTVIAGTVGAAHAEKIAYCIETARKVGVPVIGLYDSAGARLHSVKRIPGPAAASDHRRSEPNDRGHGESRSGERKEAIRYANGHPPSCRR